MRNLVVNQALWETQYHFLLVTNIYECLTCTISLYKHLAWIVSFNSDPYLGIRFYYYLYFIGVETEAQTLNNLPKVTKNK